MVSTNRVSDRMSRSRRSLAAPPAVRMTGGKGGGGGEVSQPPDDRAQLGRQLTAHQPRQPQHPERGHLEGEEIGHEHHPRNHVERREEDHQQIELVPVALEVVPRPKGGDLNGELDDEESREAQVEPVHKEVEAIVLEAVALVLLEIRVVGVELGGG